MAGNAIESAIYAFEGLLPAIEAPPIAARRAFEHAGLRITTEAWRTLSLDARTRLSIAGAGEYVDIEVVGAIARQASPPPQRVPMGGDPDAGVPPEALVRALEPGRIIDPQQWSSLRPLDRYALVHTYRRATARSSFVILGEAFDALMTAAPAVADESGSSAATRLDRGAVRWDPSSPQPQPPASTISTHLDADGAVHMVPVGEKTATARRAVATGVVTMRAETVARLLSRDTPKGEVLATARIAGIMAAKRTPELIPLCHAVALTGVKVDLEVDEPGARVIVTATATALDRTGVEMEALVAVSAACLTIYDMLKGIDRDLVIGDVKLLEKSGGRTGHYVRGGDRQA
jgi:cyclic pyranopterin phosphate synthase